VILFKSHRWQETLREALGVALVLLLVGQALVAAVRPESLALVIPAKAYLSRTYGDAYRAYASRVGRFVPGTGKLR
jgi:protein-S-isoprenylcysteine O-methyltransferase Ste14